MILIKGSWIVSAGFFNGLMLGFEWDLDMQYVAFCLGPLRLFFGKMFDDFDDEYYDELEEDINKEKDKDA